MIFWKGVTQMIEFKHVSKQFNHHLALDDLSFRIDEGEIFGIVGESGSGKSTLLRMINGLESPTSGEVKVNGVNPHQLKRQDLRSFRKEIGMMFQHANLLQMQTVKQNVELPLKLHRYEKALSIDEVLAFVGLTHKKDAYPSQLSGGQLQRVGLAQALIKRPRLLLCDEPTSALDAKMRDSVIDVLKKAQEAFNMTLVIVTHELEVIQSLATRTCILEGGRVRDIINVPVNTPIDTTKSYYDRVLEVLAND